MEKKVIVIDEVTKDGFEEKMEECLKAGYIPCGHPAIAFSNGEYRGVARYVVVMIKINEKIASNLL